MHSRVLLIDDIATIHKIVDLTIDKDQFELSNAYSADEGLELASVVRPDIILLNNTMFGDDPLGYVSDLRRYNEHAGIILLVGAYEEFLETELANLDVQDYLVKPFNAATLNHALNMILSHDKTITEAKEAMAAAPSSVGAEFPEIEDTEKIEDIEEEESIEEDIKEDVPEKKSVAETATLLDIDTTESVAEKGKKETEKVNEELSILDLPPISVKDIIAPKVFTAPGDSQSIVLRGEGKATIKSGAEELSVKPSADSDKPEEKPEETEEQDADMKEHLEQDIELEIVEKYVDEELAEEEDLDADTQPDRHSHLGLPFDEDDKLMADTEELIDEAVSLADDLESELLGDGLPAEEPVSEEEPTEEIEEIEETEEEEVEEWVSTDDPALDAAIAMMEAKAEEEAKAAEEARLAEQAEEVVEEEQVEEVIEEEPAIEEPIAEEIDTIEEEQVEEITEEEPAIEEPIAEEIDTVEEEQVEEIIEEEPAIEEPIAEEADTAEEEQVEEVIEEEPAIEEPEVVAEDEQTEDIQELMSPFDTDEDFGDGSAEGFRRLADLVGVQETQPATSPASQSLPVGMGRLTIDLPKEDIIALFERSINKDAIQNIVRATLRESLEETLNRIVKEEFGKIGDKE